MKVLNKAWSEKGWVIGLSFIIYHLSISHAVAQTDVKVEFFTPSIVHVVKGTPTKTLVVTAKPNEATNIQHPTPNIWKSSELTVKLDPEMKSLTFMTNKGKVLLKEKGWSLIRKNLDSLNCRFHLRGC